MVDLAPFRALRYAPGTDLAEVTAPPYDAIDEALAQRLRRRHPHNVVRLELSSSGERDPDGSGRYERARDTYEDWVGSGALQRDEEPTLTFYEQRCHGPNAPRQRGVIAAVRLEPWATRTVLPHERVFPGPVADRLRLLEALPVNISPVYLLARSEPRDLTAAFDVVSARVPDAAFDDGEMQHLIWASSEPDVIAAVARAYASQPLLVADGHHRYTTALEYQAMSGREVPGADRILAYVVGDETSQGHGPTIRPMHRLVSDIVEDPTATLEERGFELREVPGSGVALAAIRSVLEDRAVVCVMVTASTISQVRRRADRGGGGARSAQEQLDIATVDEAIVPVISRSVGEDLASTSEARQALADVEGGRVDAALLVRPVEVGRVWEVAQAGARMPAKSTSFQPKPRTGLVLRPLGEA